MVDISELKLCSGAELLIAKDKSYVLFCCSHHNFTTGIQTAPGNENWVQVVSGSPFQVDAALIQVTNKSLTKHWQTF